MGWKKANDTVRNAAEDAIVQDAKDKAAEAAAKKRDEERRKEEGTK